MPDSVSWWRDQAQETNVSDAAHRPYRELLRRILCSVGTALQRIRR
ncbi:hypothetical protein [Microbacterium gorillae]